MKKIAIKTILCAAFTFALMFAFTPAAYADETSSEPSTSNNTAELTVSSDQTSTNTSDADDTASLTTSSDQNNTSSEQTSTNSEQANSNSDQTTTSSADSDEIVGCLTIVASYHEGENITDGHSFVMYTSYKDGETLTFTDLYGYYVPTEEYSAEEAADHSLASSASNKSYVMSKMFPGLSYDELTDEQKKAVDDAVNKLANTCLPYTEGTIVAGSNDRYCQTSYTYVLNTGDYLTIGNYAMTPGDGVMQMALDALMYGDIKKVIVDDFGEAVVTNAVDGLSKFLYYWATGADTYTNSDGKKVSIADFLKTYIGSDPAAGKPYSSDQIKGGIKNFLLTTVETAAENTVDTLINSYLNNINLLNGDTTGGLFVNREMWRQKSWQSFDPNNAYSVDITQQQLNDLMAYVNSGKANHYSLLAHNCTTVAADAWNAAVGYVRDANGKNTSVKSALFMDEKDTTYSLISGLISTPKRAYEVIATWATEDLGGTANLANTDSAMKIVRGVEVPTTPVVTPTAFDNASNTTSASVSSALPTTSDQTPLTMWLLVAIIAGAVVLITRKEWKLN